jgi:two-component system sensor histidine kinase KdpD
LSSVSHDLRTPLASIVGAATTLQSLGDRLTADKRESLAETIAGESRRLNRYIQNLLDMTKVDHGAVLAEAEWVDLRDVALAARARLRDALGEREVTQSIPEDAAFVHADPTLIEQILVNILDNAAKYSDARGGVRIDASTRHDVVVLSVSDEGPGVRPEDRERIFEPFHKVDAGDRGGGGTGLGLSIARGFARAMGGDVLARDASGGRGARFELILPQTTHPAFDLEEGGAAAPMLSDDAA